MSRAITGCWLGVALLLSACPRDEPSRTAPPRLANLWHYEVTLDAQLEHADAQLCFEGVRPNALRAGVDRAAPYLESAHWLSPGPRRKLPVRDGKVRLDGMPVEGCVHYRVDLGRAAGQGLRLAMRRGEALMASPALWLWRPEWYHTRAQAFLRLRLPDGIRASTPWQFEGGRARLTARDFKYRAYTAFGPFEPVRLEHRGASASLATVGAPLALSDDESRRWLRGATDAVSDVLGRFPTEHLQVLALNAGPLSTPTDYGAVGRSGGASVLVYVSATTDAEALTRDWILPHELSHLLLPHLEAEDAWLSEGIATYYQEVLRARAGLKDARQAWGALFRMMSAAQQWGTGRSFAQESRDMHRTLAYRRVYWAGAAAALLADARLRHESEGRMSLDRAIERAPWWDERPRTWSAEQVVDALDAASGSRVCGSLAAELLPSTRFPPVEPLFERLGVHEVEGRIELTDSAPWAHVRRAIMTPRDGQTARGRPTPPRP